MEQTDLEHLNEELDQLGFRAPGGMRLDSRGYLRSPSERPLSSVSSGAGSRQELMTRMGLSTPDSIRSRGVHSPRFRRDSRLASPAESYRPSSRVSQR